MLSSELPDLFRFMRSGVDGGHSQFAAAAADASALLSFDWRTPTRAYE